MMSSLQKRAHKKRVGDFWDDCTRMTQMILWPETHPTQRLMRFRLVLVLLPNSTSVGESHLSGAFFPGRIANNASQALIDEEMTHYKTIVISHKVFIHFLTPHGQFLLADIISTREGSSETSAPKTLVISFLGQAIYVQFVDVDSWGLRSCWPTTQQPGPFPLLNSIKGQAPADGAPPAAPA